VSHETHSVAQQLRSVGARRRELAIVYEREKREWVEEGEGGYADGYIYTYIFMYVYMYICV